MADRITATEATRIKNAIDNDEATLEDIAAYINFWVSVETEKAVNEAMESLLQSTLKAEHDEAHARAQLAQIELKERAYEAVARLNDVKEEPR